MPHWEVQNRPHFVTIRCAGTLPPETIRRLDEMHEALAKIVPQSPEFALMQRLMFRTVEQQLDRGTGFAPFSTPALCEEFRVRLTELVPGDGWSVAHWAIMPNHVHLLLCPCRAAPTALRSTIARLKGGFAREANRTLGRSGAFWQSEWFDRWVRDEPEYARTRTYIRQNPVKARLAPNWESYPWVQ